MMAGAALTQLQLAAALAEQIYRRNANDLPIQPGDDLNVQGVAVGNLNGFATSETSDGLTYYYTARGFVGQVVTDGDTLYVVFRGTDAASSFLDGFSEALASGLNQTALDPSKQSDLGDFVNDLLLGLGTTQITQLDDALTLTRAAEAQAAAKGQQVVVVGQSLGGGVAGLVSAIENVPGYALDPAPFDNQLAIVAEERALTQSNLNLGQVPLSVLLSASQDGQKSILLENGNSLADITQYFGLASAILAKFHANLLLNLFTASVTGEVLTSGIPGIALYLGGARQFAVARDRIDVGVSASVSESTTTAVSLHSPTLMNLLLRTDRLSRGAEQAARPAERTDRAEPQAGGDRGRAAGAGTTVGADQIRVRASGLERSLRRAEESGGAGARPRQG
jgi:hypothetical protein